ncbi:MAG TPA: hypothetical protein VN028_01160, partial [Rhodocyclaceae bacterium]|nr:hypothetical protein [Rhodocyclaceae bacterium]
MPHSSARPQYAPLEKGQPGFTLLVTGLLALAWVVTAWLVADQFARWRSSDLLATHENQINRSIETIAVGLDRDLTMLHGLPAVLGQNGLLIDALRVSNATPPLDRAENRRSVWTTAAALQPLHRRFAEARRSLGAFSVIWAIDLHGNCISASNYESPESFVGTNYRDRKYFSEAMLGENGRQYAIGRKTNIPGLFFSAPVRDTGGKIVGAVVGKIDLPQLAYALKQSEAIMTDENGVIILAHDKSLEMRTLPNSTVMNLSEEQRLSRYRRTEFSPLRLVRWTDVRYPGLVRIDDDPNPYLIRVENIPNNDIGIAVLHPFPEIAGIDRDKLALFVLLCAVGLLLIAGLAATSVYIADMRRSRLMLDARSREIGRHNELLQMIAQGAPAAEVLGEIARFSQSRFANGQSLIHLLAEDGLHLQLTAAPSLPIALYHRIAELEIGSADCPLDDAQQDLAVMHCDESTEAPSCTALGRLLTGQTRFSIWAAAIRDEEYVLLGLLSLVVPHGLAP